MHAYRGKDFGANLPLTKRAGLDAPPRSPGNGAPPHRPPDPPEPSTPDRRRHPRVAPPTSPVGWKYGMRALLASLPLLASDVVALFVSLAVPWALVWSEMPGFEIDFLRLFGLLAIGIVAAKTALRLYPGFGVHGVVELERCVIASTLLFMAFILADFIYGDGWTLRTFLLATGATHLLIAPTFRSLTRTAFSRYAWWRQRLLVLGSGPDAQRVKDYFEANPGLGFSPLSLNGDDGRRLSRPDQGIALEPQIVPRLAERHDALCAAVPVTEDGNGPAELFLEQCAQVFPQLLVIYPEPGRPPDLWTSPASVGGALGLRIGTSLVNPAAKVVKRMMDLALTIPITVLALPLFVIVALAVKVTSPGPVIYSSQRLGKGRRPFDTLKFRTMYIDADEVLESVLRTDERRREEWARTQKLIDDPRVTPVGHWLRRFSLDELPQLWNVIRGDMSLIGPRPVIPSEVSRRGRDTGLYLSVRPGLTGLWQISGRSNTTYDERIRLDNQYVRNWSPWLDIHILVRTVGVVFSGDGAY